MIGLDKNQVAHLKPFDIRLETRLRGGEGAKPKCSQKLQSQ